MVQLCLLEEGPWFLASNVETARVTRDLRWLLLKLEYDFCTPYNIPAMDSPMDVGPPAPLPVVLALDASRKLNSDVEWH